MRPRARARGLVLAAVVAMAAASGVGAQGIELADVEAAAARGDTTAQRMLGEARIYGLAGVPQDVAAGRGLLERSAASGDGLAKTSLGKILLDGYYLPAEPDRAVSLLEEAAAAGVVRAQTTLGSALFWGGPIAADPARGRALLDQAARAGDVEALRILGEQLVGGWVLDPEPKVGFAMLEQAIAQGDPKASVALGALLLSGSGLPADPDRARMLFEAAAKSGNGEGLERYGDWLMWSRRNPAGAETYLRQAGELGRGSAWSRLAEGAMYGYLPPRSRAKFEGYAEKARSAGDERIAVLEAERRMWGISMRASGPGAIAVLEQAVEAGNATALKYLIGLVRDGNGMNVRKRPERARAYLSRFSDLLTPTEAAQLAMTIDAATANSPAAQAAVAEDLARHPEFRSPWFGRELFKANPNLAVRLLQTDMKRRGLYSGPLDGLATRPTLRALLQDCMTLQDGARCRDGVMDPVVIGALLAR
ncbi:tetratricopeptide repeat protein [Rhodovulum euryhalinum]|nr:tetratricopeptide repeat protein [Rhodovulum euryhalinum]